MSAMPPIATELIRFAELTRCAKGLNRSRGRVPAETEEPTRRRNGAPCPEDELHSTHRNTPSRTRRSVRRADHDRDHTPDKIASIPQQDYISTAGNSNDEPLQSEMR